MRRKRHLDSRLERAQTRVIIRRDENPDSRMDATGEYLDLAAVYGNGNPVSIEIGCGKGRWICAMAKAHPARNFLAVEQTSNVLISALEAAEEEGLANVRFADCGAEYLLRHIAPNSLEAVYLNFSTPLPKQGYAKQRLTHERFLTLYARWLQGGGKLYLKTDNRDFFTFSVCSLSAFGCTIARLSVDLHKDDIPNITTEYEDKFAPLGPIYYVEAQFPEK
jgi:tRNA (guanine-N7-)-methyltransferase